MILWSHTLWIDITVKKKKSLYQISAHETSGISFKSNLKVQKRLKKIFFSDIFWF